MNSKPLTGITLIRNGNILGYPWKVCIRSLLNLCDEVLVNLGDCSDDTEIDMIHTFAGNEKLKVYQNKWDMSNTGNGVMLAQQANLMTHYSNNNWIIYLQADEMIHEKDHASLRSYIDSVNSSISQIELLRTYFWKDLTLRDLSNEIFLGRIFQKGTNHIGGDGMYLVRETGAVARNTDIPIYHYSRVGPAAHVNTRIRNLDTLFHPINEVWNMPKFSYDQTPSHLLAYTDTHPEGIIDFYSEKQ